MKISSAFIHPVILLFISFHSFAQQIPIGSWRDELPYTQCISVTEAGNRIYTATPYSIFSVDKDDNSVLRMSKINGLSDIGISCISYNAATSTVVLTYTNANIDLIRDVNVTNISDIKRKQILGNKTINSVFHYDKYAYLACGFGIVVLDLEKDEIKETYYIGPNGSPVNVLSLTTDQNDTLYAATETGIYKAWIKDPAISNFANWKVDSGLDPDARYNTITSLGNKVIVNKSDEVLNKDTVFYKENGNWQYLPTTVQNTVMNLKAAYNQLVIAYNYFVNLHDANLQYLTGIYSYPGSPFPLDAIMDKDNTIWIGDRYAGLIAADLNTGQNSGYNLSGPMTANAFAMASSGNDLFIVPGGKDASVVPLYAQAHIYHFDNTNWVNLYGGNQPVLWSCHDAVNVSVDPYDAKRVYVGYELKEEYIALAQKRIETELGELPRKKSKTKKTEYGLVENT